MTASKKIKTGFTLIELLVVITLIAILAGFVFNYASAVQRRSRDARRIADLKKIQAALEQYYVDQGTFPHDSELNLSSSSSISFGARTYLVTIPEEPTSANPPYCYHAYNRPNFDCSSVACHNYSLFSYNEVPTSTSTFLCGGRTYNFEINSDNIN